MTQPRRGWPPRPLNPDASHAARLGAEIRAHRQAHGLTLKALAARIGFSPQHLSEVERANVPMSEPFVAACDRALNAQGTLLALVPAVVCERALQRHDRATARRRSAGESPADGERQADAGVLEPARYAAHQHPSEAGEDVDPLSRRSLLGAGAGAAFGLGATTVPAAARDVDPELIAYWMKLLSVLDRHTAMFGAHEVLPAVRREIEHIAQHREVARGELRAQLQRVESRWAEFAGWLSKDVGDRHVATYWADRALRLAQEGGYQDMVSWVLMNQSRQAAARQDAQQAVALAAAALHTPQTSLHIRALCALRMAYGHALANDTDACQHSLADAYALLNNADIAKAPRDDLGGRWVTHPYLLADEARCWLWLRPAKAIAMYEDALQHWPSHRTRGRGIHQARLAVACAAADEPDRASAEGLKALSLAEATKSDFIVRELKRLDRRLAGYDMPAAAEFREAFATAL